MRHLKLEPRLVAALALSVLLQPCAWADEALSCGQRVIELGDSETKVLNACGQPTRKEGNRWIYDFGTSYPIKIVHFDNGQVLLIESESR